MKIPALRLIIGCYLVGQSSRMIVVHFFNPELRYFPITEDLFIDWIPMLILGILTFYLAYREFRDGTLFDFGIKIVKYREDYSCNADNKSAEMNNVRKEDREAED